MTLRADAISRVDDSGSVGLPPNQQLVAPGKWPLVGEKTAGPGPDEWRVSVTGLVREPLAWTVEELAKWPQVTRIVDIHCVTRWSKLGTQFGGVSLARLLERCSPLPEAQFVSFVARSERGHSTSLRLEDALQLESLIALPHEGEDLKAQHGGPVRVVVPGRYFYKSLKWLARIELLAEDRLGYWEAETGYHNHADPWREERYLAPSLDRRTVQVLLETRDFSGRDLRSLDAAGRELDGLNAQNALLRDADFRNARLARANFRKANLSNAHLEGADLRGADFTGADVEGANFRGADLRGVDFTSASLFGCTFCPEPMEESSNEPSFGPALLDAATHMDDAAIEALTPTQQAFVRRCLGK